jgi:secondary thiamine-phosphate synthase enzyme
MAVRHQQIRLQTRSRASWVDITAEVQKAVTATSLANGLCAVTCPHTTAGLTINENADPSVEHDVFRTLADLVPGRDDFEHAEGNADSHVKAMLTGFSVQVPVARGRLVLGTWQGIYFCEYDGPRSRTVNVTILGE